MLRRIPAFRRPGRFAGRGLAPASASLYRWSKDGAAGSDGSQQQKKLQAETDWRILRNLSGHLWPKDNNEVKVRVVASVSLLVASKLANIQVPFIFKALIDNLGPAAATATSGEQAAVLLASPLMLALAYGLARSSAAGFAELRNSVFSSVAHGAIRQVARDVFEHLHRLDLQFHLDRNTGQVSLFKGPSVLAGGQNVAWPGRHQL